MKSKSKQIALRLDERTLEILHEARTLSGIPLSEIVRKGALTEALQFISMFKGKPTKQVYTDCQGENQ